MNKNKLIFLRHLPVASIYSRSHVKYLPETRILFLGKFCLLHCLLVQTINFWHRRSICPAPGFEFQKALFSFEGFLKPEPLTLSRHYDKWLQNTAYINALVLTDKSYFLVPSSVVLFRLQVRALAHWRLQVRVNWSGYPASCQPLFIYLFKGYC